MQITFNSGREQTCESIERVTKGSGLTETSVYQLLDADGEVIDTVDPTWLKSIE